MNEEFALEEEFQEENIEHDVNVQAGVTKVRWQGVGVGMTADR